MMKFFNLQTLWERNNNEEKADKLDDKIRECNLIKIGEDSCRAFFLDKDEKEIIKMFPELDKYEVIRDFETLLMQEYEIDEVEIAGMTVDYEEVQEKADYYFSEIPRIIKLWESEDIDKELERFRDIFIGEVITEKVREMFDEIALTGYKIDWNIISKTAKSYK